MLNKRKYIILIFLTFIFLLQIIFPNKVKANDNITLTYIYDNVENSVTVKATSEIGFKNTKPTWELGKNKKVYIKKYNNNERYDTTFLLINGTRKVVNINVNQIDDKGPQIITKYIYDNLTDTVTVKMISNEIMADTKPTWKLSDDKLVYTKRYNKNQNYITEVKDIYGNITKVKISITQITKKVFNGIDVSVYQGTIDWTKVSESGIDFAMIRAGYRGYGDKGSLVEDTMFAKNALGAKINKIDIGVYFYSQAINIEEAKEEAKFVVSLIKKYGIDVKYPIAIDTELSPMGTGRADNISKEKRTEVVKAFCETIKQLGYKPMIYANKYWLYDNLNVQQISQYDIWLAHYIESTDYKYQYMMWQYTNTGKVDGITGNVDKNYCYKKYN